MKTAEIEKLYQQYMGYTPTSKDASQFSMMPADDVNDILAASRKDMQSNAAQKVRDVIAQLSASLPAGTTGNKEYLEQVAGGRATLEEAYGLPEAEGRVQEAEEFYRQIAIRGPMFEEVMRSGLSDISPTFLGATRKDTEDYFKGIPNPFVRDRMVNAYLDASDRSLTASLNALNGLYQTALVSAETALQAEQSHYNRVADKSKELYSELQWLARNRYEEQEEERRSGRDIQQQLELERQMKAEGLGRYYQEPVAGRDVQLPGATITPDQLSDTAYMVYSGAYKLADITPTQRQKIAGELRAIGYVRQLGADVAQDFKLVQAQMDEVMRKYKDVPMALKGVAFGRLPFAEDISEDVATFNTAVGIIGMTLTNLYEKGRITDQDRIFYLGLMPRREQELEAAQASADELTRLIGEKLKGQVNDLGGETQIPVSTMSEDDEYQEYLLQDTITNILRGEREAASK